MSETSRGTGLRPQMRERIEAQRQEIEQQTVSELKKLSKSFQASAQHELSTIASVMGQQSKVLSWSLTRLWLRPACVGLALMLGLSVGGWVLGQGLTYRIESYRKERDQLRAEIAAQEATVRELEKKTWGVGYLETATGNYLTWPGHHERPYRSLDGKWVARLSPK